MSYLKHGCTSKHVGSDFDGFLREQGMLAEAVTLKRVFAFQLGQEMERRRISRTEMALSIEATDASVDSLLDPDDVSVSLRVLEQAARAVGKTLKGELSE